MSAVAAPSQQPSASTPGFFSSAFLELNVFDQCFSSLTGEPTTSDRKMNINPDSLASPRSIPLGHHNGIEYHSLGLNLPSPSLQEKRHSLHLPHSPTIPPASYQAERRFSLPVGPHFDPSALPTLDQFSERRWSHHQPPNSNFQRTSSTWPDRDQVYIHHKSITSPSLQPITVPHPTPPSSTHSDSPANNFNSDGVLHQATMTPVDNLSPLDTLITDNTTGLGQHTPPSESPVQVQNLQYFSGPGSGNDSSLSHPPQKNTRTKRGVAKANIRKSKKNNNGEGSSAERECDVSDQKRRKFLERNRVAASKCRQKKKQWMQELETNARKAQSDSKHLHGMVGILREELLRLKGELLKHSSCGCEQISTYLLNEATKVAEGAHRSMTLLQQCTNPTSQLESQLEQLQYSSHGETSEHYDEDDMLDVEDDEVELHDPPGGRDSEHNG